MNKEHISERGEGNHNPLTIPMEEMEISKLQKVLEVMLEEILARLPLRSIARFKSVCKTWKSLIESRYFRRLFVSVHRNSHSYSWSLMIRNNYRPPITSVIGFHGCEPWVFPKSLASDILDFQRNLNLPASYFSHVASSNGLIWIEILLTRTENRPYGHKSFVGNPVLRQWVEIPPPPDEYSKATGLVTRVEEDGVVSSFKVVRTCRNIHAKPNVWRVYVYSSETRNWTLKLILSSHPFDSADFNSPLNLNGILYLRKRRWDTGERGALIGHDFYGPEAHVQCRIIPFPFPHNKDARRCLTTSGGHVIYMEVLHRRLNVWRLNHNNNSASESQVWLLLREEINMASVGFDGICYPIAMNPFDTDSVYLWSLKHDSLVFGNLRTHKFTLQKEPEYCTSEGCYSINTSNFILDIRPYMEGRILWVANLSQFVLPQWMDSVPRIGGTF